MRENAARYSSQLRQELALHNRCYARGRAHVESYGGAPVIVYAPCENGNAMETFSTPRTLEITLRGRRGSAGWARFTHRPNARAAQGRAAVVRA